MIGYLSGRVLSVDEKSLCLSVQGVGYEVQTTAQTLYRLEENSDVELYVYTHVREDQITLFGFDTKDEKNVFLKLLDVSGIGPRGALGILSLHSPSSLAKIVEEGDSSSLSQTPGIGKKTAEKIIIELRGKLGSYITETGSHALSEVRLALEALGYSPKDIQHALGELSDKTKSSQELIRESLKFLQK